MAGFRILDDDETPQSGFRVMNDEPPKPIRFMEEPNAVERFLGGVKFPDWVENLRGTAPARVLQGMADPMIGAMQTVANVLPDATGIPQAVNRRVADLEHDYEAQRKARDSEGVDLARIGGNVLSPVNAGIALKVPLATGALARAGQGAAIGAGTAAAEPVNDAENGFWGKKAGQVATGAVAGAVLTPALGAVADRAVRFLARESPEVIAARSAASTDEAISAALKDLGQTIHDIPTDQLAALREKVGMALAQGKELDPAALARKADFEALGMDPTLGQVGRDPMQFARERNLRGVEGVGEPLMARFETQGNQLRERLSAPAAGAKDAYNSGTQIAESLKNTDETLRRHVSGLYGEARASVAKDLDVPLAGLAQDYAQVLSDFGDKVPSAIQARMKFYGMDPANPSNQRALFTMQEADKLLKNINDHVGSDPTTNRALDRLRAAVKDAVKGADSEGGPFAPAVKAASERFKMQDAVPALKAAAEGSVAPDDFVRRFIIGGKTDEVKGLAQVLKQSDPSAWQEARAQLADTLKRAAFGENAAGDAPFAPSRYMEQLRRLGVDKLGAFFNAEEVSDLLRVGRVGAYINQAPNASAVNTSNTAGALMNLARRIPGGGMAVDVGKKVAGAIKDTRDVRRALASEVPSSQLPLSATQENYLRYLLGLTAGGGAAAGFAVGK